MPGSSLIKTKQKSATKNLGQRSRLKTKECLIRSRRTNRHEKPQCKRGLRLRFPIRTRAPDSIRTTILLRHRFLRKVQAPKSTSEQSIPSRLAVARCTFKTWAHRTMQRSTTRVFQSPCAGCSPKRKTSRFFVCFNTCTRKSC